MEIKRCLKIRLYPTPDQFQMFVKTGGFRRFVYNKYVEAREQFYADNIRGRNLTKDEKNKIYKGFKYTSEKDLSVRKWICPECGVEHNRDHNAAINLRNDTVNKH